MYIIYAVMLYLFVLMISVFIIRLSGSGRDKRKGILIVAVYKDVDSEKLLKSVKELYYEESFEGEHFARQIVIVDCFKRRDELKKLFEDYKAVSYMEIDELGEYLRNRENCNEQQ
ncbi:MAG: hypothetical protein IJ740_20015 [Ruminococcus sp.]|nr:hypothetical protein [Ruminococcus sp.]MBR1753132.1 hypothetical protein [Ruminococcus sp.]